MVKKIQLALAAIMVVFMFSCSNEMNVNNRNEGFVDFTVKTSIPKTIQTYASHNGGATNVDETSYDLRYILEVWTKDATPKLAYRGYKIVDDNFTKGSVTFSARLLALEYNFVFWADFVADGTTEATAHDADLFYITNNGSTEAQIIAIPTCDPGLQEISLNLTAATYNVSEDARDAYYKMLSVDLRTQSVLDNVSLNRPFGKYRLVSVDNVVDGYFSETSISKTKIEYKGSATLPTNFNALTGEVGASTIDLTGMEFTCDVVQENAVVGGVTYPDAYILAFDYIFAGAAQTVAFDVSVFSDADATAKIGSKSISNIPIKKNKLTTIVGNFFTNSFDYTVVVDDEFDGEIAYASGSVYIGATKYATIDLALAAAVTGDVITLGRGVHTVSSANAEINKDITIKGIVNSAIIEAISPAAQTTPGTQGKNPIFFITAGNVTFENIIFRTNQTPRGAQVDGITITGGLLILRNVTFDGITSESGISGAQHGRCVTVYGASTKLKVTNSTFKNFNKNGIHIIEGNATIINSNFIGKNLKNNGLITAQNGIVFMNAATGIVTNCFLRDFNYNNDTSCAILDFTDGMIIDDGGNIYSNNDYNWYDAIAGVDLIEIHI